MESSIIKGEFQYESLESISYNDGFSQVQEDDLLADEMHYREGMREEDFLNMGESRLRELAKWIGKLVKQDKDIVICIDGKERGGKSSLAYWLGLFISEVTERDFSEENFVWRTRELIKLLYDLEKRSVAIDDESGADLYKLSTMGKANVITDKALMVSGMRNQVIILVNPNLWDLSGYTRDRRIEIWIRVRYAIVGGVIYRGFAKVSSNLEQTEFGLKPFWKYEYELMFRDMPPHIKNRYKKRKEKMTYERVKELLEDSPKKREGKKDIVKKLITGIKKSGRDKGRNRIKDEEIQEWLGVSPTTVYNAKKEIEDE